MPTRCTTRFRQVNFYANADFPGQRQQCALYRDGHRLGAGSYALTAVATTAAA